MRVNRCRKAGSIVLAGSLTVGGLSESRSWELLALTHAASCKSTTIRMDRAMHPRASIAEEVLCAISIGLHAGTTRKLGHARRVFDRDGFTHRRKKQQTQHHDRAHDDAS